MGYESRIYVVDRRVAERNEGRYVYGDKIATFNLACIGNINFGIFDKPIDFSIYTDEESTEITEDCYGAELKYCHIPELLAELRRLERDEGHYRRYTMLINFLAGLDLAEWDEIVCVHYGY